ncbi:MAG: hypothetical protein MUC88_01550 [Planctomycetes bacterium]|jgi:hypothetical protein|nr:hypothetical protein [Planctomycetota bacterium]
MSEPERDRVDLNSVEHLLGYFDPQVLASYRNEAHKYVIKSDFFEGQLRITEEYYRELEQLGKTDEGVYVDFGYRTLEDGSLAVVAWLPDLFEKSKSHVQKWNAFHLEDPHWTVDHDERFDKWVRRCFGEDWDVDSGPSYSLASLARHRHIFQSSKRLSRRARPSSQSNLASGKTERECMKARP